MLNAIIGSSVFGLPSVIAARLGAASPWSWLVAAVGIGIIIACFAEVASRYGSAGGPYLYGREAFGRLVGIEMGWVAYLVRLTAAATNANLFVIYLAEFWPTARTFAPLVLALLIVPLAMINAGGVGAGARVSSLVAGLKLLPLAFFMVVGAGFLLQSEPTAFVPSEAPRLGTWLEVVLLLMFAYGGFEAALVPLGEAKNPRRDAPFALFVALGVCALIYSTVQLVVLTALPDPGSSDRPLADAARVIVGPWGATLLAAGALLSVYGYLAGAMVNVPRLTYAMADRGDLPAWLGRVHPESRVPRNSLWVFAVLVWILAASGSFLQNLTLSAVSRLFTYGVICLALPVLRTLERRGRAPSAEFVLPAGTSIAVLGLLFSLVLALRASSREAWIMGITFVAGLITWLWARSRGEDPGRASAADNRPAPVTDG